MTGPNTADRTRELGIDFGPLARELEEHQYPTTSDELVEAHGSAVLELPGGEETLRELFELLPDEDFESAAEARAAIFNTVSERAIGRKGYSDRTPPALGERQEWPNESF
ncbi:hypothetical protein CV102_24970 [Natronococcus pandeyae]|uniref:DUF2795 domain-containing protein n=1 Tax=Natronococcus pandeyae TaxID=2055836 RepID=A0A8J8TMV9_9EURY|nr:hypothetical protein [Natronococcus pandeyae]TYL36006.1 hypothetical protein CV102_24970 [Natronococcus pandeyae]